MRILAGSREDDARTGASRADDDGRVGRVAGGRGEERFGTPLVHKLVDFL